MLDSIIRIGKVSSIDEDACTAKVLFEDRDNVVSYDFPMIVPLTLQDKYYYMPHLEERVLCVLLPNAPSKGFILGSYYCDKRIPEYKDKNKVYVEFEDKTLVEYDKKEHKLKIHIPEHSETETSIEVVSESDIDIKCNSNIIVEAEKDINITAAQSINIKSTGAITIESDTSITMTAPRIDINK